MTSDAVVLRPVDLDIEAKLANPDFAREWVKMQDEEIARLRARILVLKNALRPFADVPIDSVRMNKRGLLVHESSTVRLTVWGADMFADNFYDDINITVDTFHIAAQAMEGR